MRIVYATQFEVIPRAGQTAPDLLQALAAHVSDWIVSRYPQSAASTLNLDGLPVELKPKHRIIALAEVVPGCSLVSIDWSYPHEPDESLIWQTQVTIAETLGRVEVAITVRISSVGFMVKPLEYDLRRPNLVPRLLAEFVCKAGTCIVPASPLTLDAPAVAPFVRDVLFDRQRALPVVVVSPVIWTDQTLVDPRDLQDQLAGLALVAELKTKWAGFALTESLGRFYSCYNGALRIYWPGFAPDDKSAEHMVILPAVIRRIREEGRSLPRQLFRQFAAFGAFRFTEGEITNGARSALEKRRRAHFQDLLERSKNKVGLDPADKELLDLALSENKRLEERVQELERRNVALETRTCSWFTNRFGILQSLLTLLGQMTC